MGGGTWDEAVEAGGRRYIVAAPSWSCWQAALDLASPGGEPDPQLLLEECLLICIRAEDGRSVGRADIRGLSAQDGDRLLSSALALIDEQRAALNAEVVRDRDGVLVRVPGGGLRLRSWTFGERNEALRKSLRLRDGRVRQDLTAFERELAACCVTVEGSAYADAAQWPVSLGELVMRELDALNGLEAGEAEIMAACLRTGVEHPDLALIRLCRYFGLGPEQLQQMNARTGQRLLAGLQLLEQTASEEAAAEPAEPAFIPASDPARSQPAPRIDPGEEEVTRILVYDA